MSEMSSYGNCLRSGRSKEGQGSGKSDAQVSEHHQQLVHLSLQIDLRCSVAREEAGRSRGKGGESDGMAEASLLQSSRYPSISLGCYS